MADLHPNIADLLRKTLNMSAEELRAAQAQAKEEAKADEEGKKRPVGRSADFQRISELESRPWNYFQQDEFVDAATEILKTPEGTMRLRPVQAAALIEAQRAIESGGNGIVGLMGVGSGKALVSMLLGTVLNSQRCVLLVPPSLVEQTRRVYNQMREHWQVTPSTAFHIVSYSTLSSIKRNGILEEIKPDLIIADEASQLKNKTAAKTKRVLRHLQVFKPRFCILSGTLTSRSLKDFQHVLYYVLRDRSPVPAHFPTLTEWCEALDADVDEDKRRPPGVILTFAETAPAAPAAPATAGEELLEDTKKPRDIAWAAFRNRLISTPGVVATEASQLGTSLVINKRPLELSPKVKAAMEHLQKTWERPDGEAFSDVLELAATERELSCGFWNKWIWPDDMVDTEWLEARRDWRKAVREKLRHSAPNLDSPQLIYNACLRHEQDEFCKAAGQKLKETGLPRWHHKAFDVWRKYEDRPVPPTVPQWVDEYFMIDDAVAWGREEPGIIWFAHVAVGEKIAQRGGFPFYGAGAEASAKILDETGNRTIVVSMNAHNEGKNLQHAFWRNLFTTPFAGGKLAEQVIGRTHRPYQPKDEVVCDFYLHTDNFEASFRKARRDAKYASALLGPQKLDYATLTFEGF